MKTIIICSQGKCKFTEECGEDTTVTEATVTYESRSNAETFNDFDWMTISMSYIQGRKGAQ